MGATTFSMTTISIAILGVAIVILSIFIGWMSLMLNFVMLAVIYAEYYTFPYILSVVMLSDVILSVVAPYTRSLPCSRT